MACLFELLPEGCRAEGIGSSLVESNMAYCHVWQPMVTALSKIGID